MYDHSYMYDFVRTSYVDPGYSVYSVGTPGPGTVSDTPLRLKLALLPPVPALRSLPAAPVAGRSRSRLLRRRSETRPPMEHSRSHRDRRRRRLYSSTYEGDLRPLCFLMDDLARLRMLLREGALIITGTCEYMLRCANVAAAEVGQRVTLVWPPRASEHSQAYAEYTCHGR